MKPLSIETVSLAEIEAKQLVPDPAPRRPVVLVVDDEPAIADTIVKILDNAGYAAAAAYNGESALTMALTIPPEILVTDVDLPGGINGLEVAVSMKKYVPDCKVLIFSGRPGVTDLLLDAEADGHKFPLLHKPIHPSDLLAQVHLLRGALSVE